MRTPCVVPIAPPSSSPIRFVVLNWPPMPFEARLVPATIANTVDRIDDDGGT